MVEVLSVSKKRDKNGKNYKLFRLYSPEQPIKVIRFNKTVTLLGRSSTCGYISYEVNYARSQSSDPMYNMEKGDKIVGRLVNKKVEPYMIGDQIKTYCTVPVFCSDEDPIEFEVQTMAAFKRAGKVLAKGQLNFGDFETPPPAKDLDIFKVPNNCLVVDYI